MKRLLLAAILALAFAVPALFASAPANQAAAGPAEDYDEGKIAYDKGDYTTALAIFRPLAENGNVSAQTDLGSMYTNGEGVPRDDAEAVKWYRRAAEQGDASAQSYLGVMYEAGMGAPQDFVQAYAWYSLAAAGIPPGKYRESVAKTRDDLATKMNPAQITEGRRLARDWKPRPERVE